MNDAHLALDDLRQLFHDVRQPVAGVLALVGAALAEAGVPERVRARLEQVADLAEWQADVIGQWLQETGLGQVDAGHADVVQVVNEALAAERATWPGDLVFRWPGEPAFAPLNPVVLRRAVANLVANATRAAGPSGTVAVEVRRSADGIVVVVEDSGPGFGGSGFGGPGSGGADGGSGLGLHAAARQASNYHGRLECGRGSLGGARVSLWLPLPPAETGRRIADAACSV
jgi:signal transduction histidine kinase